MVRALSENLWFAGMYEFDLVLLLLQQMRIFGHRVVDEQNPTVYILLQANVRLPHKLLCYVTFSIFCIIKTYFGLHIEDLSPTPAPSAL
jgi:two-component system LytT family sensor kinase